MGRRIRTIKTAVVKHGLESPWEDRTVEELLAEWLDLECLARKGPIDVRTQHDLDELRTWINDGYIFNSAGDYWADHEE